MEAEPSTPRSLLVRAKLEDVLTDQRVVSLRPEHTVEQALKTMASHRILSAPVVGGHAPGQTEDDIGVDILGFIDIRDILTSFLQDIKVASLEGVKMLQRMRILEEKGLQFANKSLQQLQAMGGDGGFLLESSQHKVTVMELVYDGFLYPKESQKAMHGGQRLRQVVHRLALFDKSGKITHIVSQSDVIRFLAQHADKLGDVATATVQELGFVGREVISVPPEKPAIDAMALMEQHGISAVAVVAHDGKLVGNFSVSEMRTIMSEHFGSLALPVGEFLALEHGTEYAGYVVSSAPEIQDTKGHRFAHDRGARVKSVGQEVGQRLICCTATTTLKDALRLLAQYQLHRLYVVDDKLQPIGLITLTDVLRKVCSESGAPTAI